MVRRYFHLFWWYYFEHYHHNNIPDYHVVVHNAVMAPRFLDIEPRDHGKSVRMSCAYPLWVVLTNPYNQPAEATSGGGFRYYPNCAEVISQISAAGALPERWIKRHKTELQYNRRLIADWGEQSTRNQPDGIWTADEILLKNGGHIFSKGTGSQTRGDHPTEVLCDDLEDRKRAENPDLREKDEDYFFADLYGTLTPTSRLKLIGTIVHIESILNKLWKKDPAEIIGTDGHGEKWVKFRFQAELSSGEPLAPEIWPKEKLMARKRMLLAFRPNLWYMEYQNEPQASENPVFPTTWFKKEDNNYDMHAPQFLALVRPNLKIISFMDPNVGEKETDCETSIATVGYKTRQQRPEVYVFESKAFRTSFHNRVGELLRSWEKWRGRVGIEGIAFSKDYGPEFERQCQEKMYKPDYYVTDYRDRKIKGQPMPPRLDKVSRAEHVQEFFELNCIKFDYRDQGTEKLIEQLIMFPTGSLMDRVDALVGALWEVKREWYEWLDQQGQITRTRAYDPDTGEFLG